MFATDDQEILDVVNDRDEVVGTIRRGDMMSLKEAGRFLRTVDIFIQRPNGDIYLPRRSTEKKIAPGGLDLSVGGHVLSGETYEQACIRELEEEAGINLNWDNITVIAKIKPSPNLFYFEVLYLLRTDQVPKLSPEHIEANWIPPEKLESVLRNDIPTKETLQRDIPVLLKYLRRQ